MTGRLARLAAIVAAAALSATTAAQTAPSRLDKIRQRGHLGCGVNETYGFAHTDSSRIWRGFDTDVCRAIAAAVLGSGKQVEFVPAPSVAAFRAADDIDVVSRRLTWELRREAPFGLLFGPITFYDGQGFLVSNDVPATGADALAGKPICVDGGTPFEANLSAYFAAHRLALAKRVVLTTDRRDAAIDALNRGTCKIYTADRSELVGIRLVLKTPDRFRILRDQISEEPLAPVVRDDDPKFFDVVRWTIFALISAEELGVTSANVDGLMAHSPDPAVQRLLGVLPGNGDALGLNERWAYNAIKAAGNYGEMFDRYFTTGPLPLDRGRNRLARDGGLMYAPPLR